MGSHTSHDSEVERLYANAEAEIEAEIVVDGLHVTGHDDEDDTINGEFYESELLPVLGTCRALYAFEGDFNFNSFNQWRQSISDTIADWLTLWSRDEAQTRVLASFIFTKSLSPLVVRPCQRPVVSNSKRMNEMFCLHCRVL